MKRATLLLEDAIYRQTKALSKKRRVTLKELINDLLRLALQSFPKTSKPLAPLPLHHTAPQPGIDITDRDHLYEIMEAPKALPKHD